jgi:glutaredoxin 2
MAATITYAKALKIVDQLETKDREKLFRKMREQRRKIWLAKIEAETEQALKDHRAGKLPTFSSAKDIRAYCEKICSSADD